MVDLDRARARGNPGGTLSSSPADPRVGRALLALALAIVTTRLPLLGGGFGSDDDSWRNAANAVHMWESGRYFPSRAPGFPVYDAVLAVLVPLGAWASNLASVLFQGVACLAVYRIERRASFVHPGLAAAALALAAPFAVTATQTMDYALSAALVALACDALLAGSPRGSGLALALATGARASNALALFAAIAHLVHARAGRRVVAELVVVWAIVTAVVFTPVLLSDAHAPRAGDLLGHVASHHVTAATLLPHGRGMLSFLLGKTSPLWMGLGVVAFVARRRSRVATGLRPGGAPAFEITSVALGVALYCAVPYTPAYLLPVYPMMMMLLRRALPALAFAGLALGLAVEIVALPLLTEWRVVPGALLFERAVRHEQVERTRALREEPAASRAVLLVTRQDLHRLVFSRPPLRRHPPVWEPFVGPGVALSDSRSELLYADSLGAGERDSLAAHGYVLIDRRPAREL